MVFARQWPMGRRPNRMLKKARWPPLSDGRGSVTACKYAAAFLIRARQEAILGFFSILLSREWHCIVLTAPSQKGDGSR